jgi:ABC-type hemin transport system substrate-binding protein
MTESELSALRRGAENGDTDAADELIELAGGNRTAAGQLLDLTGARVRHHDELVAADRRSVRTRRPRS